MRPEVLALVLLAACASAPKPSAEREPPLPQMMLDVTFSEPTADDGGMRAQFLSMLGREDLIDQGTLETCTPLQRNGVSVDPVEEIARAAAGNRVVIVNEAHDRPLHRVFISDLAARLRRDGFTIYAAETFLPTIRTTQQWPTITDGTYSREPTFGLLLRRMHRLGYSFVEYDDFSPEPPSENNDWRASIERRETIQAANLKRILEENPRARLFVHVGHSHVLEQPDNNGNVWMAQRLKEATGIDPITIDQIRYTSGGNLFTLCDPAQVNTRVDYRIAAPILTFDNGRPGWRQRAGQRAVAVPQELVHPAQNTIIEARIINEPDEAVPVDRLLLRPGETLPLLLAPGRYRLESWTPQSGYAALTEVDVD